VSTIEQKARFESWLAEHYLLVPDLDRNVARAAWDAALREQAGARDVVDEYWCAIAEGVIEFGMSCDDGNSGEAARDQVNGYINDQTNPGEYRLVRAALTGADRNG
jgi:hypothetical protein